ncbi:MAG: TetR/AcrR family transcriptional regulator [Candidatus Thiodiazotropha sp.]
MPYTSEHKQQSRQRILDSAAQFFLLQGYEKTGIGEIMQDAGLTHGGFYAHFSSKAELYIEAMNHAAKNGRFTAHLNNGKQGMVWFQSMLEDYLSLDHAEGDSSDAAYAVTAMMIGGVAISRAIDDPKLAKRLLLSCRQFASKLLPSD